MKYVRNKIQIKELFRFLVGGGSAVLVDYIVYRLLMLVGVDMSIAKGISYVAGATVGFIINKLWTFESKGFSKMEILRYIILYVFSACINTSVNKIAIFILDIQIFAFLCATAVSTVINFWGQKFFVFVKKEKRKWK